MTTDTEDHVVRIDYGISLEDMIAAGKYDWKNDAIVAATFPSETAGIIQFETKIFHFNRYISSTDAVATIKADDEQNRWEAARIEALLAYGAKNPKLQREYPIIGLGSIVEVRGNRYVPYLRGIGAERGLDLRWWGGVWGGGCRFLGVR
jgi:hypothetical protein